MPSKGIIKWLASAILFFIMSSGVIDPAHEESIRGVLELAVTGIVFIIATLVYGYEIIHKMKNPSDKKENAILTKAKGILSKIFLVEQKPQ